MVLAALAAVVVLTWTGGRTHLADAISRLWCRLGDCAAAAAAPSIDPWDSPDPIRRATWGSMVIIGDSFASGEGNDDYGTLGSDQRCHGSDNSYGRAVAATLDMDDRVSFVACTGAVVRDLSRRRKGQAPQLDALDADTSLVTVTIGGNDLGWVKELEACIAAVGRACEPGTDRDKFLSHRIEAMGPVLEKTYNEIQARAPHARIVVAGYPRFFPEEPHSTYTQGPLGAIDVFSTKTQEWANLRLTQFNKVIRQATEAAGVEYVDMTNAFEGHEITTDNPWYHGIEYRAGLEPLESGSFHPNTAGQARMAGLVQKQIRRPVR